MRFRYSSLITHHPLLFALALLPIVSACRETNASQGKRVIVVGFDGMDPKLTDEMLAAGRLPNFARLREQGGYVPLQTATPPQSPVAWSSLITGLNPGGHGIFDFIHRDPAPAGSSPVRLFTSNAEGAPGSWPVKAFGYKFELFPGEQKLLRYGKPFWEHLTEAGVPAHIFRMPANYPALDSKGAHFCCVTDMGTPDLVESLGTFSYYTSDPRDRGRRLNGGELHEVSVSKFRVEAEFHGAYNRLKADEKQQKKVRVPFTIYRDLKDPVVRITWQGEEVVLHQGEWSGWHPVVFELAPYVASVKGMCRFYVIGVHPDVKLYVSPFNFDPLDESAPVSMPLGFAAEVARTTGRYYTQGLPEETKGLRNKILTRDEFLAQADLVFQERMRMLDFALDHYKSGMLFFYFGSTDQIAHMFWGIRVPNHPALKPEDYAKYAGLLERVYEDADKALGRIMDREKDATILVVSDHGFESFTRGFNLNTWLVENGYAQRLDDVNLGVTLNINFNKSRAYALGINGLYINLIGREKTGIVKPAEKQALLDEISAKLKEYVDSQTGLKPIKEVYQCDRVYSGPHVGVGPDLQIGYDRGYRGSWATALAEVPEEIVEDNKDAWCGDHCIATDLVPGVLFANRQIAAENPSLEDIAPTILKEYGLAAPEAMKGTSVFEKRAASNRQDAKIATNAE